MKRYTFLGGMAIMVVLGGILMPAKTEAKTVVGALLAFAHDTFVTTVRADSENTFPESGDRIPRKTIKVVVTAYSSDVDQTDDTPCITANGHDLCDQYDTYGTGNTLAANFLPLGTRAKLPTVFGDKEFVVRDRMNARYGYGRIDVWMPTREEAKQFGVKTLELEVF